MIADCKKEPVQRPALKACFYTDSFTPKHTGQALLIIPNIREMIANTISTWMSPPTL
jgi:hypothetical protein